MRALLGLTFFSLAFVRPVTAADFFGQPQRLCSALSSVGLSTQGWRASKSIPGEWICQTPLISFGSSGSNGMENNIAFYVNGTSAAGANDIRIKININNPAERKDAFLRLEESTRSLFSVLSEKIPPDLVKAILQQKPTSITTGFGKAELILEPGRIDSFKIVLTEARFIVEKEKIRAGSVGVLSLCKAAVAKAAGYSASFIVGGGDPVQEGGYKNFVTVQQLWQQ